MSSPYPTADVSVRPAQPEDSPIFGTIQVESWRHTYRETLSSEIVDGFDPEQFGHAWALALEQHPTGIDRHYLFAACAGPHVVGFAASQPSTDPDANDHEVEITALLVTPQAQRVGHGSRLLAAVADTNNSGSPTGLRTWVLEGDPAREQFLQTAGFSPDGTWRELALLPHRTVIERRWSAFRD